MRKFEYNDENINEKQYIVAYGAIGVIILVFQKELALLTVAADGLMLILAGGLIASFLLWLLTKFAVSMKKQSLFDFASFVITKPITVIIFFLYSVQWIVLAAYEVRKLTDITEHYLLEDTPIEILTLAFLLVVIYGVAGSRVGIFRLNMMFIPFVLIVSLVILIFNIPLIEVDNLVPVFKTELKDLGQGLLIMTGIFIAGGAGVSLFYTSLVESDQSLPKMAILGTMIPVILFFLFYFVSIGVFGNDVTKNLLYASIELGKTVNVPGGVFERFESIFFIIWMMAVFNLTTMIVDLAVMTLQSIFKNTKKIHLLFILSPIIFLISMVPQNIVESAEMGKWVTYSLFFYPLILTFILYTVSKIRGVKAGG